MGMPASASPAVAGGLTGAIGRWWEKRKRRRADRMESEVHARENLRDYQQYTTERWSGP
jgi:hypothetical protein